jgi:hypothetical protein
MSDIEKPSVAAQARFGRGGEMEVDETTETDLGDWGISEPGPERETRVEEEAASEFGVDDRAVTKEQASEQETLVPDVEEDQQTLTGEAAATQSKW